MDDNDAPTSDQQANGSTQKGPNEETEWENINMENVTSSNLDPIQYDYKDMNGQREKKKRKEREDKKKRRRERRKENRRKKKEDRRREKHKRKRKKKKMMMVEDSESDNESDSEDDNMDVSPEKQQPFVPSFMKNDSSTSSNTQRKKSSSSRRKGRKSRGSGSTRKKIPTYPILRKNSKMVERLNKRPSDLSIDYLMLRGEQRQIQNIDNNNNYLIQLWTVHHKTGPRVVSQTTFKGWTLHKVLSDNGVNLRNIKLYDVAGNSCSVDNPSDVFNYDGGDLERSSSHERPRKPNKKRRGKMVPLKLVTHPVGGSSSETDDDLVKSSSRSVGGEKKTSKKRKRSVMEAHTYRHSKGRHKIPIQLPPPKKRKLNNKKSSSVNLTSSIRRKKNTNHHLTNGINKVTKETLDEVFEGVEDVYIKAGEDFKEAWKTIYQKKMMFPERMQQIEDLGLNEDSFQLDLINLETLTF